MVRLCCQHVCYSPWCSRPPCRHPAGPVCTEPFHSSASTPMSPAHCYCTEPEAHRWTLLRCTNAHSEWHPTTTTTHTFWVTHPLSSATLCFPFRRMGSIDLSLGYLFQFKCPQLGIRNLSAKQSQILCPPLGDIFMKRHSWLFIMFFSVIIWCVVTAGQAVLITSQLLLMTVIGIDLIKCICDLSFVKEDCFVLLKCSR